MYRRISLICKIASVLVFIEGSNDKVSIPEIAIFWIRNLLTNTCKGHVIYGGFAAVARRARDVDRMLHGRRSAANAGSATLSAGVES